jgi:serine/threonine protein kinase
MAYLLLACPKCHAGYKIQRESVQAEVTCRACGHRWVPAQTASAPAAPPPLPKAPVARHEVGEGLVAADQVGALKALAVTHDSRVAPVGRSAVVPGPAPKPPAADVLDAMALAVGPKSGAGRSAATPGGLSSDGSRISGSVVREDKTDPLVGQTINDFKIQSRIGSGGFGVVYKAFDANLQRSVAIKMLPPKIAKSSQGLVERFLREARSAAKLSHPNIVTIHQICPYRDTYYIVMELVDGGALHEFLAVQKRFTPPEAVRVIRAAAEGLGHAHRRGIIHRDIKPGNIMMTNDGQVKISDFGLARDVLQGRDIVGPGHSLGTPRYMAPEQALGGEPTSASDLYSLAATFYALLTGRPPFEGTSDRDVMRKHVTEDVPDPRKCVPDLPVAVFRFFERAMAKQAEDRYQTAEEFIEALDRLDFTKASAAASPAQALSAQIGSMMTEDRGGHVTKAIERVAVRVQRQRTPPPGRPASVDPSGRRPKKSSRGLWIVIGIGAAVVIGAAIVLAIVLSPKPPVVPSTPPKLPPSSSAPVPPPAAPPTKAVEAPPENPPEKAVPRPPTKGNGESSTKGGGEPPSKAAADREREQSAQEALKAAKAYEADASANRWKVKQYYEEQILNVYPGTEAAKEALKAVERLEKEAGTETPAP